MSRGLSDGWPNWEVIASSVAALISCETLWHPRPRDNCEANDIIKIIEKNREPVQIIELEFRKQPSAIGKFAHTDKGQFGQFTLRGDS